MSSYYHVEQLRKQLQSFSSEDRLYAQCLDLIALLQTFDWKPKTLEELSWWQQNVRKLARDLAQFEGTDRGRVNRNCVNEVIMICLNNL